MRFLVLIRGALTPPPRIEAPVMKIPLQEEVGSLHASDTTDTHTNPHRVRSALGKDQCLSMPMHRDLSLRGTDRH